MNHAKFSTSPRLQRVHELLKSGEHSTMAICLDAKVCAVSTVIAELRENGASIDCRRVDRIFYYKMTRRVPQH